MKKNKLLQKLNANKNFASENQSGETRKSKPLIDPKNFFLGNDSKLGFTVKENYASHLEGLNGEELNDHRRFLVALSQDLRLDFGRGMRCDRFGKPYYWVTFQNGRITQGLKLVYFDGLDKLIETNGNYDFDISLEGLIEELEDEIDGLSDDEILSEA